MQGGVEQRRVDAEPARLGGEVLGQADLGVDHLAGPPRGAQALERRAVAEGRAALVETCDVNGFRVSWRPLGQGLGVLVREAERADRVQGPVLSGARVHADRPAARVLAGADGDLHLHAALLGQHQRGSDGQLLDVVAADLVTGPDRQLHQGGPGQQGAAEHLVVGQPGVGAQGQVAGEHEAVAVGEPDRRPEQRVVRGSEPEAGRVARGAVQLEPVPLVLEGVGRQVDTAGAAALVVARPVHSHTVDEHGRQRGEQRGRLVAVLAQGRRALSHCRQHTVRPELQELRHALLAQVLDARVEPHGLTNVPHPVLRGRRVTLGVAHHRDAGLRIGQRGRDRAELLQHRVHQRGVERVADGQTTGFAASEL